VKEDKRRERRRGGKGRRKSLSYLMSMATFTDVSSLHFAFLSGQGAYAVEDIVEAGGCCGGQGGDRRSEEGED
jgi:hypothetical protein